MPHCSPVCRSIVAATGHSSAVKPDTKVHRQAMRSSRADSALFALSLDEAACPVAGLCASGALKLMMRFEGNQPFPIGPFQPIAGTSRSRTACI